MQFMDFEDDDDIMQPLDASQVTFDKDDANASKFVCLAVVCIVSVSAVAYFFWHLLVMLEAPMHHNGSAP
jgi:hypothetical protein